MYPFGMPIVVYLFLAGVAAGMALFGSVAASSSDPDEERGGRTAVAWAAACSLVGALFLVADLDRPGDFGIVLLTANPASAIAWGVRILVVFLFSAFAVALPSGAWRGLDTGSLWTLRAAACGLAVYPAFVLRQADAFVLWQGSMLVPLIAISSLHGGACAVASIGRESRASERARSAERVLGGLQLLLACLFIVGVAGVVERMPAAVFWLVVVVVGTLVPLCAVGMRQRSAVAGRCALVLLGAFALRYWLLAVGQSIHSS